MNHLVREKIFKLNSEDDFKRAEQFKSELEDEGFRVETITHGFEDVRIKGVKTNRKKW